MILDKIYNRFSKMCSCRKMSNRRCYNQNEKNGHMNMEDLILMMRYLERLKLDPDRTKKLLDLPKGKRKYLVKDGKNEYFL
jgi:hypothetical protein